MSIRSPAKSLDSEKEIKVKIPVAYHVKLHAFKIVTGRQMGDTVTDALDAYFKNHHRAADVGTAETPSHALPRE